MIDFARITVIAGEGGGGSGSFLHIKGKRLGKADGGDGGKGGDVYLEVTGDLNTLEPFRYVKEYKAQAGGRGSANRRKGADGEDLIVKVPVGTVVKISNFKFQISNFFDLTEAGQKVLVVRGGEGGRGNAHLRDEYGRRPKVGEPGEEGEKVELTLELKLIADVGLIGLPNAGKSTLLAALTSAKPKVADYPFTTLEPNLGVISGSSFMVYRSLGKRKKEKTTHEPLTINDSRLVIADIPGLIEGASEGKGLGDLFLRHIERTKILVHLIDISTESPKWQDYQTIRGELKSYSKELIKKKEITVLTKIDLVPKEKVQETLKLFRGKKKKIVAISAVSGQGLNDLLGHLRGLTSNRGQTSDA